MKQLLVITLSAITMWPTELVSNSCIAAKPVKISGALCGRVFDASGAIVQDVALRVVDESGRVIADTKVDQKGDFIFSNLSKGRYRLDTTTVGWRISFGGFEITSENTSSCRKPVSVYLGFTSCEGGIWKKRPNNY